MKQDNSPAADAKTSDDTISGIKGGVHQDLIHESAAKHVTGRADYTDDIAEPIGTLHAYLGLSERGHAKIVGGLDLAPPCLDMDGVVGVLTADDIPGINDISPPSHLDDEPVFVTDTCEFGGGSRCLL